MSITNQATVASGTKLAAGGCRGHPPSASTTPQSAIARAMERDMTAQARWLAAQAARRGYRSLDELLFRTPALYTRLASRWRQLHPLLQAA